MEKREMQWRYSALAKKENNVSFIGRIVAYRYLDMDVTIVEALNAAERFFSLQASGQPVPAFFAASV